MFALQVVLNQIALGPCVLASVFAWNLALTGHPRAIPGKIRRDLPPTIVNGWKFWVPASVINFRVVPLQYQVCTCADCDSLNMADCLLQAESRCDM